MHANPATSRKPICTLHAHGGERTLELPGALLKLPVAIGARDGCRLIAEASGWTIPGVVSLDATGAPVLRLAGPIDEPGLVRVRRPMGAP